jgi:hypothetical protein
MFNIKHSDTVPRNFILAVNPISGSWSEGDGLDMENYKDLGFANWISSSSTTGWVNQGGDFFSTPQFSQSFETGVEDLEIDITELVENWLDNSIPTNGLNIRLTSSQEQSNTSYYTKKFSDRRSEFFYNKPLIEARFNSSIKDDRSNFFISSSNAPAEDNLNKLYLYNRHRGSLKDIPAVGTGNIFLSLYSGSTGPEGNPLTLHTGFSSVTGSWVSTGIYSASVGISSSFKYVYDVWHDNSVLTFSLGSEIEILQSQDETNFSNSQYVANVVDLKSEYHIDEKIRFSLFIRDKNWQPNIYSVATSEIKTKVIKDLYYKINRLTDNLEVIAYGTGSTQHTLTSYDGTGNYFDLDGSLFEPDYTYKLKFGYKENNKFYELKEVFKFRVIK